MNNLRRDIQPGETVIVKKEVLKRKYLAKAKRQFVCQSGAGMKANTFGKTIYGYWLDDPDPEVDMMISGYDISKEETDK